MPASELPAVRHLPPTVDQSALGRRGYFYVGGDYVETGSGRLMSGQMFVEALVPKAVTRPYPLVLIHGGGQTGTNFLQTPDGRMGWADYFVQQGYVVYVVDQPARGRSPWHGEINGSTRPVTVRTAEHRFTNCATHAEWPQATKHTQWAHNCFDAFYAGQFPTMESDVETQTLVQKAGAALLDRIGPAILLTHSQSGPHGFLIADARPRLVKMLVSIEPAGPPVENLIAGMGQAKPYGLAAVPLTYDPPIARADELSFVKQERPDAPGLITGWLQREPARQLKHLHDIPILVITGEASYHAPYDHCTVNYLRQAGVSVDFVRLEDRGILGNGHMMMLEKNNLEIAALLHDWMTLRFS